MNGRKTFSLFSDVCYVVKSKVNGKHLILTRKSSAKIRKTVYGNFFRKPFSKTRMRLPRPFHSSHSVSALSLSHCLLSSHSPNLSHPSHLQPPEPPTATPCLALHPLSHPVSRTPPEPPQPEPPSAPLGLSLALADRRSPRCHRSARSQSPIHWSSIRQSARSQPICP